MEVFLKFTSEHKVEILITLLNLSKEFKVHNMKKFQFACFHFLPI